MRKIDVKSEFDPPKWPSCEEVCHKVSACHFATLRHVCNAYTCFTMQEAQWTRLPLARLSQAAGGSTVVRLRIRSIRNGEDRPCRHYFRHFWLLLVLSQLPSLALGASTPACSRPSIGSQVTNPPELRSINGVLELNLYFRGDVTHKGEMPVRYCYVTDSGLQSPTLRVAPGDQLIIHFHNQLDLIENPTAYDKGVNAPASSRQKLDCSDASMSPTATNLHFHGLNIPPVCHQDDVIHTTIRAGQSFDYRVMIPKDESPGLYWYHPHMHGYTERQVQGGASGALIVEDHSDSKSVPKKIPERVLVLRDQPLSDISPSEKPTPAWDITLNYVPVSYKQYVPARIQLPPDREEFWRVLNAGAGTFFNLQILSDDKPQPLQLIAIDGVPIEAASTRRLTTSIELPPASRAEFLVTTPSSGADAQLVTQAWNTGPRGDIDPGRPIADLVSDAKVDDSTRDTHRKTNGISTATQVIDLRKVKATGSRKLYFSEITADPNDADTLTYFFITVAGQRPALYNMQAPPNIEVHRGAVEDWFIENRSPEDHVFHAHQLHFQVLEINGKPLDDRDIRDTVNVEHWSGAGPYPSVKIRMDFRPSNLAGGTFPYHCHILRHEDMGMMGTIKVLPSTNGPVNRDRGTQ
jgi:FtsP/CotA-like multicopper oxidase with cupredoxin domain